MDDFEKQWAVALKKSQQKGRSQNETELSLATQKKQVEEEMNYFKQKLSEAIENKDKKQAAECLKKLYKNRAKQVQIETEETIEKFGFLPPETAQQITYNYFFDCYNLTATINLTLKTFNESA